MPSARRLQILPETNKTRSLNTPLLSCRSLSPSVWLARRSTCRFEEGLLIFAFFLVGLPQPDATAKLSCSAPLLAAQICPAPRAPLTEGTQAASYLWAKPSAKCIQLLVVPPPPGSAFFLVAITLNQPKKEPFVSHELPASRSPVAREEPRVTCGAATASSRL